MSLDVEMTCLECGCGFTVNPDVDLDCHCPACGSQDTRADA